MQTGRHRRSWRARQSTLLWAVAGWLLGCAGIAAATHTSANYQLVTDSLDTGSAVFAPSYAQRAALEPVVAYAVSTIPDAAARFVYHGFVPQLDAPLFAVADISVNIQADPILASPQEPVTYSGTVINNGPELAPGVVLTAELPPNLVLNNVALSQGSFFQTGSTLRCEMGSLEPGAAVTFALQTTVTANGLARVEVRATVEAVDQNIVGNTAEAETRVVTTVRFIQPGGGTWFNAAHWSPAVIPGPDHKAVISNVVDLYTADVEVAGLELAGGRLAGGHRLTIHQLGRWTGGEIQAGLQVVVAPGALLLVPSGFVSLRAGAGIENFGTVRLEGSGLQSVFGAWVTNHGLFEMVGERSFLRYQDSSFTFLNRAGATFRKAAGALTNGVNVAFRNEGLIEVLEGTLEFNGTFVNGGFSLVNLGTNRASAGAQILYSRANSFENGTSFEGPGFHRIVAASLSPNDGSSFSGTIHGDVELVNSVMGGEFTHLGQLTWLSGHFRPANGSMLTLGPGSLLQLVGGGGRALVSGYAIRNYGTIRQFSTSLTTTTESGGSVDNHGVYEMSGDSGLGSILFSNRLTGVFRKVTGTGTNGVAGAFRNEGLIEVLSGTVEFNGSFINGGYSLVNRGISRAASGAQVRYVKANSFADGSVFEGPGLHRIVAATMGPGDGSNFEGVLRGEVEIANGIMGGTFTNAGAITWSGGNWQVGVMTIARNGSLVLTGGGDRTLGFGYAIRNLGTVKLASAGLNASNGGAIENHGLFDLAGDLSVRSGVGMTNRETGVVRKSGGTGASGLPGAFVQAGGTLDVQTGTLALGGPYAPSPTSVLRVTVGGVAPGSGFSRLTTVGTATLGGSLEVEPVHGFVPELSQVFQVVQASSRSGSFSKFSAGHPGAGLGFRPDYVADGVLLRVIPGAAILNASSVRWQNGRFQFSFEAGSGGTYVVEATTDLGGGVPWQPVQTNTASGLSIVVEDVKAGEFSQRFYRAVLQP